MKKLLITSFLIIPSLLASQYYIDGKVIDGEFNDILPFANVLVSQIEPIQFSDGQETDFDGKFFIDDLAEGKYEITISFVGYETLKITDIFISPTNPNQTIEVVLNPASESLDEVVVTTSARNNSENAVLSIQKNSGVLLDGLSLESIKKAGDNDIASAIKRVPGISIQEGKYVYVRGLGDRYSKTLINDLEVPGLDPDKNTLQLDIFPTSLIDNIQVVKSASANLDADFTGGIVNVVLKDFSNSPTYNLSFGVRYNPDMHFNDNYIYSERSSTDFLGFDSDYRELPIARGTFIPSPVNESADRNLLTQYTDSFNKVMEPLSDSSFMDYNFGLSASNSYILENDHKWGYIASFNYRSEQSFLDDFLNSTYRFNESGMTKSSDNDGLFGSENVTLNLLTGLTYSSKSTKYKLNFLAIQNGESNSRRGGFYKFTSDEFDGVGNFLTYTQRTILSVPISVKHNFNEDGSTNLSIKANATKAIVDDKDLKVTVFEIIDNNRYRLSRNGSGFPKRIWRSLEEDVITAKIDFSKSGQIKSLPYKLDIGASYLYKNRIFETDRFVIDYKGNNVDLNGVPNNILKTENIWTLSKNTGSYVTGILQEENQFDSYIDKLSAYVSGEFNLSEKLKTIAGLRLENYKLTYTGELFGNVYDEVLFADRSDFFPSLNLIYSLNDSNQLRLSGYKTTARPSFKENSTAIILDPVTNNRFYGNPDLKPSLIMNYDIRYEKYSENGQFFAISGFFKNFQDPIEIQLFDRSDDNGFIARNNDEADVYGFEVESRQNLFLNDRNKLSYNINFSIIESRLKYGKIEEDIRRFRLPEGEEFQEFRRLQGQAPYIVNASLNYESFEKNIEASIFYNTQGKTLEIVGNDTVTDVFTLPFNSLNTSIEKRFINQDGKIKTLRFKVDNILGDKRESMYEFFNFEPKTFSYRNYGTTYSLSYSINL